MSTRKAVLALAIAGLFAAPAAFATGGLDFVGGEAGYRSHPMPSAKTRAEVQRDLERFTSNPVTADGMRFVGGEIGWVPDAAQRPAATKTRAEVKEELRDFIANPASEGGWRYVGGEVGWVLDPPAARAASRLAGAAR
ncbi:MAG: hypothetical protein AB1761_18070 [Pseudomonadota bacterium]